MTALYDKILSYAPEQYYPFGLESRYVAGSSVQPQIGSPLGTGGTSTWSWRNSTATTRETLPTGGPDGNGAWRTSFIQNNLTVTPDFRVLSGNMTTPELSDSDFSIGIWIRFTNPINTNDGTGTTEVSTVFAITSRSITTTIRIGLGAPTSPNRGKLTSSIAAGVWSANRVDDGNWHYIAFRGKETATNVFTRELYLDGQLFQSSTITVSFATSSSYNFGINAQTAKTGNLVSIEWAQFYVTPYATIDATAISEIWTVGSNPVVLGQLKYWNGTAWTTPLSITQWNGTSWTTFNGKYWTGSAWQNITL